MLHALTENILHRSYLQETENVDYSEIQHGIMLLIQAIAYSLSPKKNDDNNNNNSNNAN